MAGRRKTRFIALLRGINVGGHNKISMLELRNLCTENGWGDVTSYIQTGNLLFSATSTRQALERHLEELIEKKFGLSVPAIVREARTWSAYAEGNPFPGASKTEPNLVVLALSKKRAAKGAAEALLGRAAGGERVVQVDDALWIHFPNGVARSKLSPAAMDRDVGSVVTARNWRTVQRLVTMVEAS